MKKIIIVGLLSSVLFVACGESERNIDVNENINIKQNEPIRITDQGTGADDTMRKIEARKEKQRQEYEKRLKEDIEFDNFIEELEKSLEVN